MGAPAEIHHATTIALGDHAAMIRGASGAGKSDLALRCLAVPAGFAAPGAAALVADDQTLVRAQKGMVLVSAPEAIKGLMEVRGVGIVRREVVETARLVLVADLVGREQVERLPDLDNTVPIAGVAVRVIKFWPWEASAPLKLLLALRNAGKACG